MSRLRRSRFLLRQKKTRGLRPGLDDIAADAAPQEDLGYMSFESSTYSLFCDSATP
jgi:hypothetical protein